jgi:hypothetical protein
LRVYAQKLFGACFENRPDECAGVVKTRKTLIVAGERRSLCGKRQYNLIAEAFNYPL